MDLFCKRKGCNVKKGFTLIELMIVIAIIGILAAVAIPMYRAQTCKSKLTEVTNVMSVVASAISTYYNDKGYLPGNLNNQTEIFTSLYVRYQGIPRVGALWWVNNGPGNQYLEARIDIDECSEFDERQIRLAVVSGGHGADPVKWDWQQGTANPLGAVYMPHR